MSELPYVVITERGLSTLATYHEINVILKQIFEIFKTNPDIDLHEPGIMIQVHIVDGEIVCELVEESSGEAL